MEMKFKNYNYNENTINLDIKNATIIGITGKKTEQLIDLLSLTMLGKGVFEINGEKITNDTIYKYKKKISLITKEFPIYPFIETLKDLMYYTIIKYNLIMRDQEKKIEDALKIVGLDESYLTRKINTLSTTEKKLIQISISLLSNPDLIITIEPFNNLDLTKEKKLKMLFNRLKEQFKKTIIIVTNDSNILYKYTDELILVKKNRIFLTGKTQNIYKRVDFLRKNGFEIPEIVEFTYLAKKKKKIKLDYHKDIRDIIKDIYKHI